GAAAGLLSGPPLWCSPHSLMLANYRGDASVVRLRRLHDLRDSRVRGRRLRCPGKLVAALQEVRLAPLVALEPRDQRERPVGGEENEVAQPPGSALLGRGGNRLDEAKHDVQADPE